METIAGLHVSWDGGGDDGAPPRAVEVELVGSGPIQETSGRKKRLALLTLWKQEVREEEESGISS